MPSKLEIARKKLNIARANIEPRVVVKKVDGEWQARVYYGNTFDEARTYFAGDKDDAMQTADDMRRDLARPELKARDKAAFEKPARRKAAPPPLDLDAIRDLELFIENTGALYPLKLTIREALTKKLLRGTYKHDKAWMAWLAYVARGVTLYKRETDAKASFTLAERSTLARKFADQAEEAWKDQGGQIRALAMEACGCEHGPEVHVDPYDKEADRLTRKWMEDDPHEFKRHDSGRAVNYTAKDAGFDVDSSMSRIWHSTDGDWQGQVFATKNPNEFAWMAANLRTPGPYDTRGIVSDWQAAVAAAKHGMAEGRMNEIATGR